MSCVWIIVFSAGRSSELLSLQLFFVQLLSFRSVELTDAASGVRDEGEAGRAPGRGGGGAPPFAVTGEGCNGRSAPSRRGCDALPFARVDQSVAFPLPAKDQSAVLRKFETESILFTSTLLN